MAGGNPLATPGHGFVAFADRLADVSGPIVRRYFRTGIEVIDKPDMTPVTRADRETEAALRDAINATYPDHGIIGEEFGNERADAEYVWVIDPIDGTQAFIAGIPLFGTLIALARHGTPILGVIDHPALGERWIGGEGHPTTINGERAGARECRALNGATLFTTSPDLFDAAESERFARVAGDVKMCRYGTDCYGYALVASGHGDLVIEAGLDATDFAALEPVVRHAGGVMTDWCAQALTLASDGRVIAAGDARVHAAALSLLGG